MPVWNNDEEVLKESVVGTLDKDEYIRALALEAASRVYSNKPVSSKNILDYAVDFESYIRTGFTQ